MKAASLRALVMLGCLALANCASEPNQPAELEPLSLPPLGAVDDEVKREIEEAIQAAESTASAESFGDAALVLHAHTFHRVAAIAYRNAIQLQPDEAAWHYLLGRCYRNLQRYEEARQSFERAATHSPNSPLPPIRLAEIAIQEGDDVRAEAALDQLSQAEQGQPLPLYLRAQVAQIGGRHEEAIQLLERVLELSPRSSAAHYPLGLAYRAVGRLEEAEQMLTQRGDQEPPFEDPWMQRVVARSGGMRLHQLRATALYQDGNFEAAHQEYLLALEAAPDSPLILSNLALTKIQLGQDDEALELLERAYAADAGDTFASYNLGTLLMRRGAPSRAIPILEATLESDPQHALAATNLGNALCQLERCAEALPYYEEAIQLGAGTPALIASTARALGAHGRWNDALQLLEGAHQRQPDEATIRVALTRVLSSAPDNSVRDGRRALQLAAPLAQQRSDLNTLEALAMVAAENGYFDQAIQLQGPIVDAMREAGDPRLEAARLAYESYKSGQPNRAPWFD